MPYLRPSYSGKFYHPIGRAIHEETHQIFIANCDSDRVDIFSETGELLYQLVYVIVSCEDQTVSKFSLTEMCRVRSIGGWGSKN